MWGCHCDRWGTEQCVWGNRKIESAHANDKGCWSVQEVALGEAATVEIFVWANVSLCIAMC